MPRVARPEYANRVNTNLSDAELEALERIARRDGAPIAQVIRRLVRAGLVVDELPRNQALPAS